MKISIAECGIVEKDFSEKFSKDLQNLVMRSIDVWVEEVGTVAAANIVLSSLAFCGVSTMRAMKIVGEMKGKPFPNNSFTEFAQAAEEITRKRKS